jgi:hypothetical protein
MEKLSSRSRRLEEKLRNGNGIVIKSRQRIIGK